MQEEILDDFKIKRTRNSGILILGMAIFVA
jgi:hypothetical protein